MRRVRAFLLTLIVLWLGGFAWFVNALNQDSPAPDSITDAIVVLTGGSQRIESGLALLAAGKATKLFVSGVNPGVTEQDMVRESHAPAALIACCVVLGHDADNTEGNAVETADWLHAEKFHSLRLVTADYHMQRALLEFRRVLSADYLIIPDPVHPDGSRHGAPAWLRGTSHVVLIEYLKYLGALVRPWLQRASQP